MNIETLLTSKGRDIMSDATAKYLAAHAGELTPLVAECAGMARRDLGTDASADALARRTAVHLLRRIAHVPVKAAKSGSQAVTESGSGDAAAAAVIAGEGNTTKGAKGAKKKDAAEPTKEPAGADA